VLSSVVMRSYNRAEMLCHLAEFVLRHEASGIRAGWPVTAPQIFRALLFNTLTVRSIWDPLVRAAARGMTGNVG
jgi:hypothetical protein